MEKRKIGINKWVIILAVIIMAVLTFECFAIFTDALDLSLSDTEMKDKVLTTYYEGVAGDGLFDVVEGANISEGDYPLPYKIVSSYSQYKEILENTKDLSPLFADEVKASLNDVGYNRAYFNKYSLILIEETPREYLDIQTIETNGDEMRIYLSGEMRRPRADQAQLFVIPVSKKVMKNIDEISINIKQW